MNAHWMLPVLLSAVTLGFYDICKKASVRDNSVMPALFFATLTGSALFVAVSLASGGFAEALLCGWRVWRLVLAKSAIVSASWVCVYYAMRELPISIAAPIRASSPLWTFIGGALLFGELPSPPQAVGMAAVFAGYYLFTVLGKLEGITPGGSRGLRLIFAGTLLGAASALYDKLLLGKLALPRNSVQLWFSLDLVAILGAAWLVRRLFGGQRRFQWRWSIPATGALLIVADWLYFYAVSIPDTQIATISVLRRASCVVTFLAGGMLFGDRNLTGKAFALALVLAGVILVYLA